MSKQKILSTTIMFLVIIATIVLFQTIFGEINSLVAVTGITAALSLLGTDYMINPVKNTIYFICLEVVLGIASFIGSLNAVLGLIVTFCMIFYILYNFTYDNKKPTYIGFTLGYFFMLYSPVTLQELPLRLVGLAICGLAIMVLQFLANRHLIQKQTHYQLKSVISSVIEEITLIESQSDLKKLSNLNQTAHTTIRGLIEKLYEYIDKGAKLPLFLFQELFIAHFLESLNLKINDLVKSGHFKYTPNFQSLSSLLNQIDLFIDHKVDIDCLFSELDSFLTFTDFVKSKSYLDFELNTDAAILKRDLQNTKNKDLSTLYNQYFITNLTDRLTSFKNNLSKDSLRFTFAFRCALLTSLGVFIVSAFNIESGKWIVFSLHSIIQPYSDYSKTKGHQRLIGTVIGLIIFEVLFSLFTDTTIRTLIILIVGYLMNYQTNYQGQVICMTISALGAASIGTDITKIAFERLVFVIIGTLIALYANKIILPYRVSDATKSNLNESISLNNKIISLLYNKCLNHTISHKELITLIQINKFINRKIDFNNSLLSSNNINNYIYNQHIFINDVRILANMFIDFEKSNTNKLTLLHDLDYLNNNLISKKDILNYIDEINDLFHQLILINMLKLKENISYSTMLSKQIIQSI